jgi:hypothetical protein
MTYDNDQDFIRADTKSFSNVEPSQTKIVPVDLNQPIVEEEDEDMFGLDFLADYQSSMRQKNSTNKTKDRTESEYISSPVSRPSLKKRVSVKRVIRRTSISSTSNVQKRKF